MNCSDNGCLTAALMVGMKGVRVLAAGEVAGELHLIVETAEQVEGCRSYGVVSGAHRRVSTCCATPCSGTGQWW